MDDFHISDEEAAVETFQPGSQPVLLQTPRVDNCRIPDPATGVELPGGDNSWATFADEDSEEEQCLKEEAQRRARQQIEREAKREGRPEQGGEILYLPSKMQGITILEEIGDHMFRATNKQLKAKVAGIAYRKSKDLKDRDGTVMPWGTIIKGLDEGDGWIKTRTKG